MQTMTKAATPNYYPSSTFAPFPPIESKLKRIIILLLFSYNSLNSQCQGKNNFWKSVLFFAFDAQVSKNGRGQEDAGWCFHDIFQVFLSLGCEGGRGG